MIRSARALVDSAHDHLLGWATAVMQEADLCEVEVLGDFPAAGAPPGGRLVLYPYRLEPWPKRVETSAPTRMLQQRAPSAFPGAWAALAEGLTAGLERVLPRARGGSLLQRPALTALPPGLQAWYRARGAPWVGRPEGTDGALSSSSPPVEHAPTEHVCLPMLGWKNPFVVRVFYLALAEPAPGSRAPGVSALGALAVAVNAARTLPVVVPPPAEAAAVAAFAEALATDLGGPEGAALSAAADAIRQPATWPLTLVPFPEIERDDLAGLMRALGRPLQPSLHVAVQIPLGAAPLFEPAGRIHVETRPLGPSREGA